ncbi:MAG: SDR family NAD(P)-dependent oxidoreductase [Acetobacteraceae bacterium]|nr:SDR family NAD(P)-dependent oxidoreductase [Acetobacteraceae bacterium]
MARFTDQVAVVTGGASGIGAAIVARLRSEGAKVSIWDLTLASDGDHAVAVDLTDPTAAERATAATLAAFGRIDILVACAGITGPNGATWEYAVSDWLRVIDINLNAVFYTCRAVVPVMKAANYGRIVNIASIAGKEGNPNGAAYSASKAGVIALTKSLGKELATTKICVNAVAPAAVQSPLFAQMTPEFLDYILSKIPMGRFGEVEEVASLVCWLASQEASFSTGATFDCSGGRATF